LNNSTTFYVYLTKGRVLLIGDNLEDDEHSHHALQITVNLEHNHFVLRQRDRELEVQAAIIKPDQPHHAIASDSWRAVLLLDPQTDYARRIGQRFSANEGIVILSETETDFCRHSLSSFIGAAQSIEVADTAISAILDHLAGPSQRTTAPHPRIAKALLRIHQTQAQQLSLKQLATHVALSESRLSHLFKQEIGIPIQRYLLWYKVAAAAFNIGRGMSLTDAAGAAGFADSAHFSRTFRVMFGLTPSQILRRSKSVQIISDTV
jgi:AraC-like DNA-binding protein